MIERRNMSNRLLPYKFIVQAVVQQIAKDGQVLGEVSSEPVQLFSTDQLAAWASNFPSSLAGLKEAQSAGAKLAPYKFIVEAVVQEKDKSGKVIAEHNSQPTSLFGCDNLAAWAKEFPDRLTKAVAQEKASG